MIKENMQALGFIQHWGYSPAINFFNDVDVDVKQLDKEINVLLSRTGGDARHIFKSLCDVLPLDKERTAPINLYIHENNKETIARIILFFTLFCETGMSERERMEIFLDIYGNTLVRDKTAKYVEGVTQELIQLVTEDDKCQSVLKDIVSWETMKYKDRDELEDVFSSWLPVHKFDIENLRDTRMRALYKERYDFRSNIVDWDFNMGVKDFARFVNQREFKDWRLTGIAFETRLASGTVPNRTLASFVEGKDVSTNIVNLTKCLF